MALQPDALIIFLHLPKTAGRTLRHLLDRNYGSDHVVKIRSGGHTYDEKDAARSIGASTRIIMGHINFGLHNALDRPCQYITLLRDPVERIVSYYYFIQRTPSHIYYDQIVGSGLSLAEFATSGLFADLDNGQTRAIVGRTDFGTRPVEDALIDADLDIAKDRLRTDFLAFGIQERFDESLLWLSKCLGWGPVYYRSVNKTQGRPRVSDIPPDVIQTIREHNHIDLALYEWATRRFDSEVRSGLVWPHFQLGRLRIRNYFYSFVARAKSVLSRT